MKKERYTRLNNTKERLYLHELNEGWHYCRTFPDLLVGPGMAQFEMCDCSRNMENKVPAKCWPNGAKSSTFEPVVGVTAWE